MSERRVSVIEAAASRLRDMARAAGDGELLGSEEALVEALGVSRATVRQVARLLEREGLLRVRRGASGGYFAARPDLGAVEAAVSAYLETLDMDAQDVTVVASILWVEVMRKAAGLGSPAAKAMASKYRDLVAGLRDDAPFHEILQIEQDSRAEIFALTKARYIELIFQINMAFAAKRFAPTWAADDSDAHREFVHAWRKAKTLEFDAILDGDPELGMLAARHERNLWHRRIWLPPAARRAAARA